MSNDWEAQKENFQPLRSGRKLGTSAFSRSQSQPKLSTESVAPFTAESREHYLKRVRDQFEENVRTATSSQARLRLWNQHLAWTQAEFPRGARDGHLDACLRKFITEFESDATCNQDPMYFNAWLTYAGLHKSPLDIFQYMHDQRLCTELACFHYVWAEELELAGHVKQADKVFIDGIKQLKANKNRGDATDAKSDMTASTDATADHNLEQHVILQRRYDRFLLRTMKGAMSRSDRPAVVDASDETPQRGILGSLRVFGQRNQVNNVRHVGSVGSMDGPSLFGGSARQQQHQQVTGRSVVASDSKFDVHSDSTRGMRRQMSFPSSLLTRRRDALLGGEGDVNEASTTDENHRRPGQWTKVKYDNKPSEEDVDDCEDIATTPRTATPAFSIPTVDDGGVMGDGSHRFVTDVSKGSNNVERRVNLRALTVAEPPAAVPPALATRTGHATQLPHERPMYPKHMIYDSHGREVTSIEELRAAKWRRNRIPPSQQIRQTSVEKPIDRPMYPKHLIYNDRGEEVASFEELRAANWRHSRTMRPRPVQQVATKPKERPMYPKHLIYDSQGREMASLEELRAAQWRRTRAVRAHKVQVQQAAKKPTERPMYPKHLIYDERGREVASFEELRAATFRSAGARRFRAAIGLSQMPIKHELGDIESRVALLSSGPPEDTIALLSAPVDLGVTGVADTVLSTTDAEYPPVACRVSDEGAVAGSVDSRRQSINNVTSAAYREINNLWRADSLIANSGDAVGVAEAVDLAEPNTRGGNAPVKFDVLPDDKPPQPFVIPTRTAFASAAAGRRPALRPADARRGALHANCENLPPADLPRVCEAEFEKENVRPAMAISESSGSAGAPARPPMKRKTSGILSPAQDLPFVPLDERDGHHLTREEQRQEAEAEARLAAAQHPLPPPNDNADSIAYFQPGASVAAPARPLDETMLAPQSEAQFCDMVRLVSTPSCPSTRRCRRNDDDECGLDLAAADTCAVEIVTRASRLAAERAHQEAAMTATATLSTSTGIVGKADVKQGVVERDPTNAGEAVSTLADSRLLPPPAPALPRPVIPATEDMKSKAADIRRRSTAAEDVGPLSPILETTQELNYKSVSSNYMSSSSSSSGTSSCNTASSFSHVAHHHSRHSLGKSLHARSGAAFADHPLHSINELEAEDGGGDGGYNSHDVEAATTGNQRRPIHASVTPKTATVPANESAVVDDDDEDDYESLIHRPTMTTFISQQHQPPPFSVCDESRVCSFVATSPEPMAPATSTAAELSSLRLQTCDRSSIRLDASPPTMCAVGLSSLSLLATPQVSNVRSSRTLDMTPAAGLIPPLDETGRDEVFTPTSDSEAVEELPATALTTIDDPFDDDLKLALLAASDVTTKAGYRDLTSNDGGAKLPAIRSNVDKLTIPGGRDHFTTFSVVNKCIGQGSYGKVYRARMVTSGDGSASEVIERTLSDVEVVLKVTRERAAVWEFHIASQLQARLVADSLRSHEAINVSADHFMRIDRCYQFKDGCMLASPYQPCGSLLDLVNHSRSAASVSSMNVASIMYGQTSAYFFLAQLLEVGRALHQMHIVHADIKADNVLLLPRLFEVSPTDVMVAVKRPDLQPVVQLIDFGRSIDMTAVRRHTASRDVVFRHTFAKADKTPDMLAGRPWTHQLDYYGIAGIAHLLLTGDYIAIVSGSDGCYKQRASIKRWNNTALWQDFFRQFLNIAQSEDGVDAHFPSLSDWHDRVASQLAMSEQQLHAWHRDVIGGYKKTLPVE